MIELWGGGSFYNGHEDGWRPPDDMDAIDRVNGLAFHRRPAEEDDVRREIAEGTIQVLDEPAATEPGHRTTNVRYFPHDLGVRIIKELPKRPPVN